MRLGVSKTGAVRVREYTHINVKAKCARDAWAKKKTDVRCDKFVHVTGTWSCRRNHAVPV